MNGQPPTGESTPAAATDAPAPAAESGVTAMQRRFARARGARQHLAALALELGVVFIGVYAAFGLTDWDRRRQDDARRERLERALLVELRGTNAMARQGQAAVHGLLAQFEASRLRGEHPVPAPMLSETRADPNVWNATVAAGGIGLIDIDSFVQLARYYNGVQAALESNQTLKRLSEQLLIPHQGDPPASFYRSGTNELSPEYSWYPAMLQQLEEVSGIVAVRGDSVIARLEASSHPGDREGTPR